MGKKIVKLTPRAEEDIREIFIYYLEFSLKAAEVRIDSILKKLDLLSDMPYLGHVLPEFENEKLREIIVDGYLIAYYLVSDVQIDVLSIHRSRKK